MKLIIFGFLSGIISGMGIGGGTILIPSLVLFQGLDQLQAQGINLIVFIPIGIIALITHKKQGNIESKYNKKIIMGGLVGAIIGSIIALRLDPNSLRKYFGIFLGGMGLFEFFKKEK